MRRSSARLVTATLALVAAAAVWHLSKTVFPYLSLNHDEGVYLQQAAMLLEGRLFMYPPVEDVFLPWFFVEDGGRIYPKYTPVPAAMFALGKLVGAYRYALPAIAASNIALVVGVVTEAFDRRTGLLAGVVVLASPLFLIDSAVFLPYAPTTLLNLAFAYAYLRADRTGDRRWAVGAGVAVGLAFFARAYTAVLFALPFVGHALWTVRGDLRPAVRERILTDSLSRQVTTAAAGLAGVAVTLSYNAVTTGSPLLFPFHAFEPQDTIGFGHRELTGYGIEYTPELALGATQRVLELFFGQWLAGGVVTTGFALLGLGVALRRGMDGRQAALAGVAGTVIIGNVFFWGNYNILGEVGNGLVGVLGPRYHLDLLVPTAAFAAVGIVTTVAWLHGLGLTLAADRDWTWPGDRAIRVAAVLVVVVALVPAGTTTADQIDHRIDRNMDATDTYERVYEPFDGGPPENATVLFPRPYGPWLNHPFQPYRNSPGFDGQAVYALDGKPFAVADAFPNRTLYRYAYRGPWAPYAGSPEGARLQRVRDVTGSTVTLNATVGVPAGTESVTVRVGSGEASAYQAPADWDGSLSVHMRVTAEAVVLRGADESTKRLPRDGDDPVQLSVFVDYGATGGFTYQFEMPVRTTDRQVRALTPEVVRCRGATICGDAGAYVPDLAPEGAFVETSLLAVNTSDTGLQRQGANTWN